MSKLDLCDIWEPKGRLQPTKRPYNRCSLVPLYPICFTQIRPTVCRRAWIWLWECKNCKKEYIDAASYIQSCSCDRKSRHYKYPIEVERTCTVCGKLFTYVQNKKQHSIKTCSSACASKALEVQVAKRLHTQSRGKVNTKVALFDRSVFCVSGIYNVSCDHYSECQDYRINLEYGPYYKADGSCYSSDRPKHMLY